MCNNAHPAKIGVLVVTYNQYEQTAAFVRRFIETFGNDRSIHLLVLDNDSHDQSYRRLCSDFPTVDIRPLNDNYGCVTGRNVGIVELEKLGCKYVYISDNDIIIEDPEFFRKLLIFHESHPEIDGSCPIVRWFDDRKIQTLGTKRVFGAFTRNVTQPNGIQRIDALPGCAQFISIRSFKKFGLYDNDFTPVSIEDYEWGMRASAEGASLTNYPIVEVLHTHDRAVKDSANKTLFYLAGRMVYLRKHLSLWRVLFEVRFILMHLLVFPISVLYRGYLLGVRKTLSDRNWVFEKFADSGLERYYKKCSE